MVSESLSIYYLQISTKDLAAIHPTEFTQIDGCNREEELNL